AEDDALGRHLLVELLQVRDADTELDRSGRVPFQRRMQRQRRLSGRKLAPVRRRELQRQAEGVAMERNGAIHIADEFDDVCEFHSGGSPSVREDTSTTAVRTRYLLRYGAGPGSAERLQRKSVRHERFRERPL